MRGKPTVEELGIDVAAQRWRRSGEGDGTIEIAIVRGHPAAAPGEEWVLMRVAGDPSGRVLVYDKNEWECFLDGVRNGEFDDAQGTRPGDAPENEARGTPPGGAAPGNDAQGTRPGGAPGNDVLDNGAPDRPADAPGNDAAG